MVTIEIVLQDSLTGRAQGLSIGGKELDDIIVGTTVDEGKLRDLLQRRTARAAQLLKAGFEGRGV